MGIDPEEEVLRAFLRVLFPNNELVISVVIFSVVLVSTVVSILGTLAMGSKLGLLVVACAWIAGLTMPVGGSLSVLGAILFIAAMVFGLLFANTRSLHFS